MKYISIILILLTIPAFSIGGANTHSFDLERDSVQYFSIPDADEGNLVLTGSFTLEAWIKLESIDVEHNIIADTESTGLSGYLFRIPDTELLKCFTLGAVTFDTVDGVTALVAGRWYHVACVHVSGSSLTVYINGIPDGTIAANDDPVDNTLEFRIGTRSTGTGNELDGLIDEVKIWNVARTEAQLRASYQKELTDLNDPNLVGYWKFNGGLTDSSGNAHTLTNNNAAQESRDHAPTTVDIIGILTKREKIKV